jgi:hypothetical protein
LQLERGDNNEAQNENCKHRWYKARGHKISKRSERDDFHLRLLAHRKSGGVEFDPAVLFKVEQAGAQLPDFVEGELSEGGEVEADGELWARTRGSDGRHDELRDVGSVFGT